MATSCYTFPASLSLWYLCALTHLSCAGAGTSSKPASSLVRYWLTLGEDGCSVFSLLESCFYSSWQFIAFEPSPPLIFPALSLFSPTSKWLSAPWSLMSSLVSAVRMCRYCWLHLIKRPGEIWILTAMTGRWTQPTTAELISLCPLPVIWWISFPESSVGKI